jgi:hypothetical protein
MLGELPQFYMFPRSQRNISFYKMKRNKEIKRELFPSVVGGSHFCENHRFLGPVLRTASVLFLSFEVFPSANSPGFQKKNIYPVRRFSGPAVLTNHDLKKKLHWASNWA